MSTTDLTNVNDNTALATIDLINMLKSSSEIVKNLLPNQLDRIIAGLTPEQIKAMSELQPGESVPITILRDRTWSELTNWGLANIPIEDILIIKSQQSITENQQ